MGEKCFNQVCRAAVDLKQVLVRTWFGSGGGGLKDGTGQHAKVGNPYGLAVDGAGNLYLSSTGAHVIQRIDLKGRSQVFAGAPWTGTGGAGSTNGKGTQALFSSPLGLAVGKDGAVYVADHNNNRVRKIGPDGTTTTLAGSSAGYEDGQGGAAKLNKPVGLAADSKGDLYVADHNNHRIRKITPAGVVTTLAGSGSYGFKDGTGKAASFYHPFGVAVDHLDNVYVTESAGNRVRKITSAGVVTTLAGSKSGAKGTTDAVGSSARFSGPSGIAVDHAGILYVAEIDNHRIRRITPDGTVTTLAGSTAGFAEGGGATARFKGPRLLAINSAGNLLVADHDNHRIREVELRRDVCSGSSPCNAPACNTASGKCAAEAVCDDLNACTVDTCAAATGICTYKTAPTGTACDDGDPCTVGVQCVGQSCRPNSKVATWSGGTAGKLDGEFAKARYDYPNEIAFSDDGHLWISDSSNHLIRRASPDGLVRAVAGSPAEAGNADGKGAAARFSSPIGIDVDAAGNAYVGDYSNHRVCKITPAGVVTTLAGFIGQGSVDGPAKVAKFNKPWGIAVTDAGVVYVADRNNHRIRQISPDGTTTTLAGSGYGMRDGQGSGAQFDQPGGLALDNSGNIIVADINNHTIRRVTPQGMVTTLAGMDVTGLIDGVGPGGTRLSNPHGVGVDRSGNIYIGDTGNHALRVLFADGTLATIAGMVNGKGAGVAGKADGLGPSASFNSPRGVAIGPDGAIYLADHSNHRVRKITPATKDCGDGNACTLDVCERNVGCANTAAAIACSDGDACTVADACTGGKCVAGKTAPNCACAGKTCDDDNACTQDSCDPVTGCAHVATNDGASCSDGNACTEGERCRGGKCLPDPGAWVVERWAGGGLGERDGFRLPQAGDLSSLKLHYPKGIDFDPAGRMFIADGGNAIVRRLDPNGYSTTIAGQAHYGGGATVKNGKALAAGFQQIIGMATDAAGNAYVTEYGSHMIRKIAADGTVTTLAGQSGYGYVNGKGTAAKFRNPMGIACDGIGGCYVADRHNHRVRKVAADGEVTLIAGSTYGYRDGQGAGARFNQPVDIALGGDGLLYVVESHNHSVRRVTLDGVVTTLAGGTGSGHLDGFGIIGSRFLSPHGVAADQLGNVFVADRSNHAIRMVLPWGETRTIGGKAGGGNAFVDGPGEQARFYHPYKLGLDVLGHVYVADEYNHVIRRLRPVGASCDDGNPCTIDACDVVKGCSHTPADAAKVCPTESACIVPTCEVKAAKCTYAARPDGWVCGAAGDCNRQCNRGSCVTAALGWTYAGGAGGFADGTVSTAKFNKPWGLAIDDKDNLYVTDRNNHRVRMIGADGAVTTYAGGAQGYAEGVGTAAKFNEPLGLDRAQDGTLFVADFSNNRIREITPAGKVSTLAGAAPGYKEGVGVLAQMNHPVGVLADNKGGAYFADSYNHRIRHIAVNGTTSLVAGNGSKGIVDGSKTGAQFSYPYDLAFDGKGGIYVTDSDNYVIRRVDLADGSVATVVGADRKYNSGMYYNGKGRLGTVLRVPVGIAVLDDGSMLVTDNHNHALRHVWPDGSSETWAGVPSTGAADGLGTDVRLFHPTEVLTDSKGDVIVADSHNHRIRKLSVSISKCSHLTGISQYTAGKTCKSIQPQYKWAGNSNFWVDPDGGDKANALKTTCDMKSDGGGWTRIDKDTPLESVGGLLGGKGRMMLKCADVGVEHLVSPASDKQWAWAGKKHAVAGPWLVKDKDNPAKTVQCGADSTFDEQKCGWGYGCSNGADKGTAKILPGLSAANACAIPTAAKPSTVLTDGEMSICAPTPYSKWRVFVRSDD